MNTDVRINIAAVEGELSKIDDYIEQLNSLYNNVNPDLTGGWDSSTSKNLISPKIQDIKDSIDTMKASVSSIRASVAKYSGNIQEADISGATNTSN